jgi:hypothetical protein
MEGLSLCVFKNEDGCSGYVIHLKFIDGLDATCVFGTLPRLGEIGVCRLKHGILVPMPELAFHRSISGLRTLVLLNSTFFAVLVLLIQTSHKEVLPVWKTEL